MWDLIQATYDLNEANREGSAAYMENVKKLKTPLQLLQNYSISLKSLKLTDLVGRKMTLIS